MVIFAVMNCSLFMLFLLILFIYYMQICAVVLADFELVIEFILVAIKSGHKCSI